MKSGLVLSLTVLALVCSGASPHTFAEEKHVSLQTPANRDDRVRRTSLRQLTGLNTLTLRGTDGNASVSFGGRADELVTGIVLRLRFSHSPALLFDQSYLRILLNDETMAIIPFTKQTAVQSNNQEFTLDPRFVSDLNQLRFQFIGHYTTGCEDLLNSNLWAEISGASELEITSRPINVPANLAYLPEPFFDRRDLKRLQLPFIFPKNSSLNIIRAGGVTASWFGQLANWRGARFPVSIGELVKGHAVVFATNTHRPEFLTTHAPVTGPTLRIMNNPLDGYSKLLLVLGRNDEDLRIAVDGLVRGSAIFSGAEAHIKKIPPAQPRMAYDAPAWVRPDRPTKFAEMVDQLSELQAQGHSPAWIRLGLRVPPDLFIWRSPGVPLNLKYRHNAVASDEGTSRLTVSMNDILLRSFELEPGSDTSILSRMRASLVNSPVHGEPGDASIPAFVLGAQNELQFAFNFNVPKNGECRDSYVQNIGGWIDPDSTIDFSGFKHYAALPELGYFATSGFPFTRYADLSQTIVILPSSPDANEIETFITLMGRMGESTGIPATAVRLLPPVDTFEYQDADLLVIGAAARIKLLDQWQTHLPSLIDHSDHQSNISTGRSNSSLQEFLGFEAKLDAEISLADASDDTAPFATFIGFESPVTPKRSVVIVTSNKTESLHIALDSLDDTGLVRAMNGSIVLMHAKKVDSFQVGKTYFVGELRPWTWLWYHTADYPLMMLVLAFVVVLLFTLMAWRGLRKIARRRLEGTS